LGFPEAQLLGKQHFCAAKKLFFGKQKFYEIKQLISNKSCRLTELIPE